ncbi:hypothetical protein [Nostoc sp.]|uniref:hypothetical protein n=1 Tax=Nostoc sp. TaxID=1180 RepID=UPI002FF67216
MPKIDRRYHNRDSYKPDLDICDRYISKRDVYDGLSASPKFAISQIAIALAIISRRDH